jgi:hypothetical protein
MRASVSTKWGGSELEPKGIITAHRRSGSHLFLQLFRMNRSRHGLPDYRIRHLEANNQYSKFIYPRGFKNVVHILRDPRDTLVSCWHYYQKIKRFSGVKDWKSPGDFIRGQLATSEILDNIEWSLEHTAKESDMQNWDEKMFTDPIGYWADYVSGWIAKGLVNIKFEQMVQIKINGEDTPLVGPFHRKGISGDWENYFSEEDNRLFMRKAGDLIDGLGYISGDHGDFTTEQFVSMIKDAR